MTKILDQIKKANDIKKIDPSQYGALADELRTFIINSVSQTGGHLASNLGVVELTMALHLCLDLPKDKIIWDVGHQSYTHKILTGRQDQFPGLRTFGGMSGFPKQRESQCDAFDTGHSSTSISAALGYVRARELTDDDYTVVAVIGDGSLTGGMAYEALNNAAHLNSNLIIILNDNKMSISENVGGMSKYLNGIRMNENYIELKSDVETALRKIPGIGDSVARGVKKSKDSLKQWLIPGGFFEDLGIEYMGPFDGHDMNQLMRAIKTAKKEKQAVIVHVITKKGKGYEPAENRPSEFHGVGKFDVQSGEIAKGSKMTYTEAFSKAIQYIGTKDERVVAVSAAMPSGTGLTKFSKRFPKRFFDVGIAEEHAVTFAGGLAAGGLKPYVAIYSSFFQRAYDQIIHDVCIPDLPVVFCVDRAGIVGADGETHQGILDLSFFSSIPNMTVFAPKNLYELYDIMKFSLDYNHPLAIRYPRGEAFDGEQEHRAPIVLGKSEMLYEGEQVALVAVGSMVETAVQVKDELAESGIQATVVNARFVKPLDTEMLDHLAEKHNMIVTMEENVIRGGFGEAVSDYYMTKGSAVYVKHVGIPDEFVEHGNVAQLKTSLGMDAWAIAGKILSEVLL
ncbi:1-deoxy-D-xylulose-5-phosphate synthase [Frisingicoccus sp.]|uniref:1-deoxy-D-xylulose-5-phosphate synthase n=1 Tax=Frisingicoccus sp. TaxID=1918627 RepID=UPI003867BEC4